MIDRGTYGRGTKAATFSLSTDVVDRLSTTVAHGGRSALVERAIVAELNRLDREAGRPGDPIDVRLETHARAIERHAKELRTLAAAARST